MEKDRNDVVVQLHEYAQFAEYGRDSTGRRYAKPCPVAISKASRKNTFDSLRSKRITAVTCDLAEEPSCESYPITDDSSCCEESQSLSEQQQLEQRKQTASFLLQLTKCLNTCKKEVYTLCPNLVRPNVNKLRKAVDNALYVAEGVKRLTISSTSSLKTLTQSAATLSRLAHKPDSVRSTSTRSSYHCLLRVRRVLNLAIQVAEQLHTYTWKMDPPAYWKSSLKIPFFFKPATLVYGSSLHKDLLISNLKKQLAMECSSSTVEMVKASPGKECDFVETCRSLRDTLNAEQKPLKQSSKPCVIVISKEARKASFDARRSKRVAAMTRKSSEHSDSETDDSDDSIDSSDSESECSDEDDSDDTADEHINGGSQGSSDQQPLVMRRKKLQLQTAAFLLQLTKCLNACKKEVYTLSPNLVRPNVNKLREAVGNALYVAEGVKRLNIHSTSTLKRLTQTATTVARLVHIPDSVHSSTETRSSYHCLLRIRRFLNLAMRVAAVLHDYTEKMISGDNKTPAKESEMNVVEITEQSQPKDRAGCHGKKKDVQGMEVNRKRRDEDMVQELNEKSQPQTEVVDPPAYWKSSLNVPFFLKSTTLVYDSSLHRDLLISNLKKQLERSSTLETVKASPGKECDFVETCRSLRSTLISDQKPLELVVSLPLVKIPSSNHVDKRSESASVIPALHARAAKLRASESCRQLVLDDVVDIGVVKGGGVSPRGPDYNAGIGEMINDFLWKVRREVVEKQSAAARNRRAVASSSILKAVKKQSTFKSSSKNRFSPYSGHSMSARG